MHLENDLSFQQQHFKQKRQICTCQPQTKLQFKHLCLFQSNIATGPQYEDSQAPVLLDMEAKRLEKQHQLICTLLHRDDIIRQEEQVQLRASFSTSCCQTALNSIIDMDMTYVDEIDRVTAP